MEAYGYIDLGKEQASEKNAQFPQIKTSSRNKSTLTPCTTRRCYFLLHTFGDSMTSFRLMMLGWLTRFKMATSRSTNLRAELPA